MTLQYKGNQCQVDERQLFHGTEEETVEYICGQNFDPRMHGKNAVKFGKGIYFARDARYSSHYTGKSTVRYMLYAQVLTGKKTEGNKMMQRPPPVDPMKPAGELYGCCVNDMRNPTVFVIFDGNQCYPTYVIEYETPKSVDDQQYSLTKQNIRSNKRTTPVPQIPQSIKVINQDHKILPNTSATTMHQTAKVATKLGECSATQDSVLTYGISSTDRKKTITRGTIGTQSPASVTEPKKAINHDDKSPPSTSASTIHQTAKVATTHKECSATQDSVLTYGISSTDRKKTITRGTIGTQSPALVTEPKKAINHDDKSPPSTGGSAMPQPVEAVTFGECSGTPDRMIMHGISRTKSLNRGDQGTKKRMAPPVPEARISKNHKSDMVPSTSTSIILNKNIHGTVRRMPKNHHSEKISANVTSATAREYSAWDVLVSEPGERFSISDKFSRNIDEKVSRAIKETKCCVIL